MWARWREHRRIARMFRNYPIYRVRKSAYHNPLVMSKLPGRVWLISVALVLMQGIALADAQYTVTVSDYCNVRELPGKDSADIGDLYAGETVAGIGYQAGWVQVSVALEVTSGWVREDMLTLADYPAGRYTNASGGRVHIRKTPDGDHAHWLDAGHTVDVIRWVSVDGVAWAVTERGYIDGGCLDPAE